MLMLGTESKTSAVSVELKSSQCFSVARLVMEETLTGRRGRCKSSWWNFNKLSRLLRSTVKNSSSDGIIGQCCEVLRVLLMLRRKSQMREKRRRAEVPSWAAVKEKQCRDVDALRRNRRERLIGWFYKDKQKGESSCFLCLSSAVGVIFYQEPVTSCCFTMVRAISLSRLMQTRHPPADRDQLVKNPSILGTTSVQRDVSFWSRRFWRCEPRRLVASAAHLVSVTRLTCKNNCDTRAGTMPFPRPDSIIVTCHSAQTESFSWYQLVLVWRTSPTRHSFCRPSAQNP